MTEKMPTAEQIMAAASGIGPLPDPPTDIDAEIAAGASEMMSEEEKQGYPPTAEELLAALRERAERGSYLDGSTKKQEVVPDDVRWEDAERAMRVCMALTLDTRFVHANNDDQPGREWYTWLPECRKKAIRYDWSDLYGNEPGTIQLVRSAKPTHADVEVIGSFMDDPADTELKAFKDKLDELLGA